MSDSIELSSYSLDACRRAADVRDILQAALEAADPAAAVRRTLRRRGSCLQVDKFFYDLDQFQRVLVLAVGKAAPAMAEAALAVLGENVRAGLVVTKHATSRALGPLQVIQADHPIPDERSLKAGQQVIALLSRATPDDLLVCLISGGGSALLATPLEGVSLGNLQMLTGKLLASGATIQEINTLRRHLDRLKGGGLARLATPVRTLSLILSDVVGNSLEAIASGLTAPDPTTKEEALDILLRYAASNVASTLLAALETSEETPKPGDPIFERVQNVVVGSNLHSAQAAVARAAALGYQSRLLTASLEGEAARVGGDLGALLREVAESGLPVARPACLVAGGETTVTLHGTGHGGRNQELALAAVQTLHRLSDVMLISMATDGEDGPTDAAGAVVTDQTLNRARNLGLDVGYFLRRNDSYSFFEALDDLLKPGPTGTNVNDLVFMFAL
jgi:glycerate 2-kinase